MNDKPRLMMQNIPIEERPRERLLANGPAALSNTELLALLLRTGSSGENVLHLSERLLAAFNGLSGLAQATYGEIEQIPGLGPAKITQILAAIELAKRLMTMPSTERPIIHRAEIAAQLVMDMRLLTQEQVRVILLDASRRVISIPTVYQGTITASVIRIAELFREAISRNSPAIILVHNHPSGDPAPSPEDVKLTHQVIEAGNLLDIQVLDHLIIGRDDWRSLKTLGLAFGQT